MKKCILALALMSGVLSAESTKQFQAFRTAEARFLYRRPLLASGAAEGLQSALPAGTEFLLVSTTRSRDWAFVRTESKVEGWIPVAWIQTPYGVNPADVRQRFYPDEVVPEVGFDFSTDVKVWGDDLLLEALKSR